MQWSTDETICAVASAPEGAVRGVVRISGPKSVASAFRLLSPSVQSKWEPKTLSAYRFEEEVYLDELMSPIKVAFHVWPSKRSYTCQPSVELHTLGAPIVLQSIVNQLCSGECRHAHPGEFTLRAFLGGRLDLAQCEAVLGVIHAESEKELNVALRQLAGGIHLPIQGIRQRLISTLAELEAGLDFVDEDIEFISDKELEIRIGAEVRQLQELAEQLKRRTVHSVLPTVVLVGEPNAGKSTLMNRLVGKDIAIVSESAGTTRDYVTAKLDRLAGSLLLIDTAGIESIDDQSPRALAQMQTATRLHDAQLVLHCIDATQTVDAIKAIATHFSQRPTEHADDWIVLTKCDCLSSESFEQVQLALLQSGKSRLAFSGEFADDAIHNWNTTASMQAVTSVLDSWLVERLSHRTDMLASTSSRCTEAILSALASLMIASENVSMNAGLELVAAELRVALHELGVVAGEVHNEEVLDNLFGKFCIGK